MIFGWQFLVVLGLFALLLEMVTPVLFFINLSFALFIAAIFSYNGFSDMVVAIVFAVISLLSLALVRPLLLKKFKNRTKNETGMENKYIGKTAKVVEQITANTGRVAIYGEEWEARLKEGVFEVIPAGETVKIVSNESIILTVEKI